MSSKTASSKTERVVVTITIDTECDHDPSWIRSNPLTFESINIGLPERLQPVFTSIGAIPTYLLTVEVLENAECVNTLNTLQGEYEYGTHLHAAFIEPEKKFYDYAGVDSPDFQCAYAPDIEYQKLANITDLFQQTLGYSPTSFRAGRYGASANSVNSLQKLGYLVDTSVTPYMQWQEPNARVDFRRAPEQPYFPARHNLSEADAFTEERILEVPVTVKPRFLRKPTWFRPWFSSVEQMKAIFKYQLDKHSDKPVVSINMMFHSMEIIEKASPYPQNTDEVKRFIDDMQLVLSWCADEGVEFAGVSALHKAYSGAQVR